MMKSLRSKVFAAVLGLLVLASAYSAAPVSRLAAQGIQLLASLAGTEQVVLNYPCTVSCGVTTATLKTYVNSAAAGQSIAPNLVSTGNFTPLAITDGTETTCVATTTYVSQIFVPAGVTITGVSIVNATAVAGNVTVGLADSTGALITAARSASTAASGTAAYQRIPFAAPYSAPGPATYYVMLQCNNTGMKFRTHTVGDFRTTSQTGGTYGTFVALTVPTTFTTAVGPIASLY